MRIALTGHLDTSKVTDVTQEIDAQLASIDASEHLIIDCNNLEFISSSGLRMLLNIRKSHPDMEVVGANNNVYNVLEMTGFTRMINVSKALRKINLDECQRLAHGANGEVYKINDEEIVKLSLFADRESDLFDEMNRAREAFVLGVPTMISFDTVEVSDGRKGIVMEALNSTTLAQHLKEYPEDLDNYLEPYLDLFRTTNSITASTELFGSTKQHLIERLTAPCNILGEELTAAVMSMIDALPDGDCLIHADGHPSNALLCGDKASRNLMLIDMGDISVGHPIMEIMGWAFIMNGPEFAPAQFIGPAALNLDYEFLQKMFRKMIASYLNITDEELIDRAVEAAGYVGVLRFICVDQIRCTTPEKKQRCMGITSSLVAQQQKVLDSIALLTELCG